MWHTHTSAGFQSSDIILLRDQKVKQVLSWMCADNESTKDQLPPCLCICLFCPSLIISFGRDLYEKHGSSLLREWEHCWGMDEWKSQQCGGVKMGYEHRNRFTLVKGRKYVYNVGEKLWFLWAAVSLSLTRWKSSSSTDLEALQPIHHQTI